DMIFQGTQFGVGPVDMMTLKGNGSVGIGSSNPTSKLQVQDRVTNTFPLSLQHARNTTNGDFTGMAFASTDNVPPGTVKSVRNDTTNSFDVVLQATPYGGSLTDVITAQGSGNVGIGTSNPAAKLDVAGDVRVSGNILGNLSLASGGALDINGSPFLHNY